MKKGKSIPNIIDESKGIHKASCFLIPRHPLIGQLSADRCWIPEARSLVWCRTGSRREGCLIERSGRNVGIECEEMWRSTCECCQHVSNSMHRQPCLIYSNLYTHRTTISASPSKILSIYICQ